MTRKTRKRKSPRKTRPKTVKRTRTRTLSPKNSVKSRGNIYVTTPVKSNNVVYNNIPSNVSNGTTGKGGNTNVIGTDTNSNRLTDQFEYVDGAVNCNLLLADEINRTSPKTQSALLQAMAEYSITVDGKTHDLPKPFICIATENPLGTIGTQALPESQLDRFMIRLSIGYPSTEDQFEIIRARKFSNPIEKITPVVNATNVIETQNYISSIKISDEVLLYLIKLCEATRNNEYVDLGISPRGIMALTRMAKVNAIFNERTYVIPEDIQYVFFDVCEHRIELKPQAKITSVTARNVLESALEQVQPPKPNVR